MCYVGRIWHIESAHACVCFSYSHQSLNSDEKLFPPKISTMGSLGFLSKSLSKIANRYFIFFLKKSGKSWSLMTDSKKKKNKGFITISETRLFVWALITDKKFMGIFCLSGDSHVYISNSTNNFLSNVSYPNWVLKNIW